MQSSLTSSVGDAIGVGLKPPAQGITLPALRTTALKPTQALLGLSLAYRRTMKTLTEVIKDDHEEMYEYHDQYERARRHGDVDAQARWIRQLTWEVARHAVGEEIVVYPLMEEHLGNKGRQLADHDREDHLVRTLHVAVLLK
ncbi:hypothetical protein GSI_10583 [Ganoderma sinense ZZ0214-1]|uniref:Hemerythrin-like domain-containing protein n=1 Tax=Ganoderma sinense ZZ0214-1 TaxID=1077348 RepID=A0A2G8S106_9APHY|nr:hypothetical protein GSI_10583 [Ganoderma sinense ZZ0214-1]